MSEPAKPAPERDSALAEILQRINHLEERLHRSLNLDGLGFRTGGLRSRRTVYVNRKQQTPDGKDSLWYFWDGEKQVPQIIQERSLVGYVRGVATRERSFRGKPSHKFHVHVETHDADYILEAGLDAIFSRSLMLVLSRLPTDVFGQPGKPIGIQVSEGDSEGVVLCNVYNPITMKPIFVERPDTPDWNDILQRAIAKVGPIKLRSYGEPSDASSHEGPE